MRIKIKKGLDIPINGRPEPLITNRKDVGTVAVLGPDTVGLRPRIDVSEGEQVKLGSTLFIDKRNPTVRFTSPGAGEVIAINRGARRALQSIVIRLDGDDEEIFASFSPEQLSKLPAESARENLLDSGLWTAIRTRPFSRIPSPETVPEAT